MNKKKTKKSFKNFLSRSPAIFLRRIAIFSKQKNHRFNRHREKITIFYRNFIAILTTMKFCEDKKKHNLDVS